MNSDGLECQLPSTLVTTHAGMESQLSAWPAPGGSVLAPFCLRRCPARPACLASFSRALGSCLLSGSLSVPDNRLVESPAFPPSAVTFPEWSGPDSSPQHLSCSHKGTRETPSSSQSADPSPVQGPMGAGAREGKEPTLQPVDRGIKIDAKTCSPRDPTVSRVGCSTQNKNCHLEWPVGQMFTILLFPTATRNHFVSFLLLSPLPPNDFLKWE